MADKGLNIDREKWWRGEEMHGVDHDATCDGYTLAEFLLMRCGMTAEEIRQLRDVEAEAQTTAPETDREEEVAKGLEALGFAVTFSGEGVPADIDEDTLDWGSCETCGADLQADGTCPDEDSHEDGDAGDTDPTCS